MEKIYKDFVGRSEICDSHLSSIKKEDIKRWVEEEFKERFFKNSHVDFSGVQLVAINAMVEFVDKMVRYDKKYETPFRIIGLEKEVLHTLPIALENGKTVQIQMGGRIDRIDEKDGAIVVNEHRIDPITVVTGMAEVRAIFKVSSIELLYNSLIWKNTIY